MAAVTICSDFGVQENKVCHSFHCFPIYFPWSDRTRWPDLHCLNVEFQASFFTLLFHFHQEALQCLLALCCKGDVICKTEVIDISSSSLESSSSPAFCMRYSAYKLKRQGDNKQLWCTPFPILNLSLVPCPVLTVTSWPAYRFLRRQVRWSGVPISLRIFHSLFWSILSKASASQWSRSRCFFSGILLLFIWFNGCWQFDLWFLYLF